RRAEDLALGRVAAHQLEGALGDAQPAHAVVDPSRAEPLLRDREARTFFAETIADRYAAVLAANLGVMIVAFTHHRDAPFDREAGRVGRHQDHAEAPMRVRMRWVGRGHYDREGRAVRTAREPLVTVDDVVIAVANRGGAEPPWIGARNFRLRHREAAADLARDQRLQPALFLLGRAEAPENLRVARIRRLRAHARRPERAPAEDLVHVDIVHERNARAPCFGRQVERPVAESLRPLLNCLHPGRIRRTTDVHSPSLALL